MPLSYRAVFPDGIKIVNLSGEVDGQHYVMLVEAETNLILLILNEDKLRVRVQGEVPAPTPVTYAPYHTLQSMNIRLEPNTRKPAINGVPKDTDLMLSTEPVTPALLQRLGLPALEIESGYQWSHLQKGNFIASKIGTKDTVAPGAASVPTTPPPSADNAPTPLSGKNLSLTTTTAGTFLSGGKGMGANLRELIHWGDQEVSNAKYMSTGDYDRYFKFLKDNGFKWVRFYIFHKSVAVDTAINRTRVVLDRLRDNGLLACVVFMDSLADSEFTFPYYLEKRGEQPPYHREAMGHLHKSFYLDQAWKAPLQPALEKLVTAFKGHAGVGMWQIINEPGVYPQPSTAQDATAVEHMLRVLSARIHTLDPGTPISAGAISTHHFAPTGADRRLYSRQFWNNQANLHIATIHAYQDRKAPGGLFADEVYMHIDAEEAQASKRAVGITEFGSRSNRVNAETGFLDRTLLQRKGSFALRWALDLESADRGIGDIDLGWMKWGSWGDFDDLTQLFREYQERLV